MECRLVPFILNTTPYLFAAWLEKHGGGIEVPYGEGRLQVQRARAQSLDVTRPDAVTFQGTYITACDENGVEHAYRKGPAIRFNLTVLSPEPQPRVEVSVSFFPELREHVSELLAAVAAAYPEAVAVPKPADGLNVEGADMPAKAEGHKRRQRGVSADTLADCLAAMRFWLDDHKSLRVATELAGVDDQTVVKWIPEALDTQDEETQGRWVRLLRALDKEKYLGPYKEKFREV